MPLANNNILDMAKLKTFADNKFDVAQKTISLFGSVENAVDKGKKCWFRAFSPFPTVFSKAFFFRFLKK